MTLFLGRERADGDKDYNINNTALARNRAKETRTVLVTICNNGAPVGGVKVTVATYAPATHPPPITMTEVTAYGSATNINARGVDPGARGCEETPIEIAGHKINLAGLYLTAHVEYSDGVTIHSPEVINLEKDPLTAIRAIGIKKRKASK